jgi:membrane protein required for colicin V production
MNWLDIVLIIILAWSVFASFRKGLTREVIGLVATVFALILSVWFYGTAGSFFAPYVKSPEMAKVAGFAAIFTLVMILGWAAGFIAGRFLKVTGLSIVDHALGAGFGVLRAVLIGVALIMMIMSFASPGGPPKSIVDSRMAPYFASAARVVSMAAPNEIKSGFRKTYDQVKAAWQQTLQDGLKSKPAAEKDQNERKI